VAAPPQQRGVSMNALSCLDLRRSSLLGRSDGIMPALSTKTKEEKAGMVAGKLSFRTKTVERAYRYWASKCGPGRMPRRSDIRPEEIPSLLPHVFLVDVRRDPLEFSFRIIGTEICSLAGRDYTGLRVNAEEYGPDWKSVFEVYWQVVHSATPEVTVRYAPWADREFLLYERLIAPLSSDGVTIDMLFGTLHQIT